MDDAPTDGCVSKGGSTAVPPLLLSPYRLPSGHYAELFERGKSIACKTLVMRWSPNGLYKVRIGVIAPKKVFHLAVERSRARRLIREAFRLERPRLCPGYDLILLGRNPLKGKKCQDIRRDFLWMCRKSGLLHKEAPHA